MTQMQQRVTTMATPPSISMICVGVVVGVVLLSVCVMLRRRCPLLMAHPSLLHIPTVHHSTTLGAPAQAIAASYRNGVVAQQQEEVRRSGELFFNTAAAADILKPVSDTLTDTACRVNSTSGQYVMREFSGLERHPSTPDACVFRPDAGLGLMDPDMNACARGSQVDDAAVIRNIQSEWVNGTQACVAQFKRGLEPKEYQSYDDAMHDKTMKRTRLYILLDARVIELEMELKELKVETAKLEVELAHITALYQQALKRVAALEVQEATYKYQIDTETRMQAERQSKINTARNKVAQLIAQNEQLKRDIANAKSELAQMSARVQTLNQQVSQKQYELSAKNNELEQAKNQQRQMLIG